MYTIGHDHIKPCSVQVGSYWLILVSLWWNQSCLWNNTQNNSWNQPVLSKEDKRFQLKDTTGALTEFKLTPDRQSINYKSDVLAIATYCPMLISLCYINVLLHIYQKSNDTLDLHTWLYLLASASASCLYLVHSRSDFRRVSSSRFACSTCVCSRPFSYAILFFCSIISFNVVSTCFCACCYKYVSNLCYKIFQNVSFSQ